ncbi:MAG: hypothetical protein Q4G71_03750 [Pseudomonadota bacterium]|nr:hypothetical protein [Pseudomonadota bacterium]
MPFFDIVVTLLLGGLLLTLSGAAVVGVPLVLLGFAVAYARIFWRLWQAFR